MSALTGKQVAGFELLDELGRGAMGVVYKARQISLDRLVAVKFLPGRLANDSKKVKRFMREARAAGKLSHPNIVAAYDVGQANGVYYIAMEYVDGQSTYKMLQHRGSLMEDEVIEIGIQAAMGLNAAHAAGILHRDVKPDNFLMDGEGNLKLADLGLARFEEDSEQGHLTQDGTAMGTPHYMSPEAAKGEKLDLRSDLYSLGASLYLLASNQTPFKGTTSAAILVSVIQDRPRPLNEMAPQLSAPFIEVIEKLMQKDPARRYQSADDVVKALQKVKSAPRVPASVSGHANWKPSTMPARQQQTPTTPVMFAVLGGVVGVVVLFGIFWMTRSTSTPTSNRKKTAAATSQNPTSATKQAKPQPAPSPTGKTREQKLAQAEAMRQGRAEHARLNRDHEQRLHDNPAALAEDWEAFIRKYPNATFTDHARRKAAEARTAAEAHIRDWETATQKAGEAIAANQPRAAALIYMDYIKRYPTTEQAKKAHAIVADLREKALVWVKAQTTMARSKALDGDFAGAQAILDKLKSELPPNFYEAAQVASVADELQRMREERAAEEAQHRAADAKRMADTHTKAEALVRTESPGFQFDRAAKEFDSVERKLELAATKKSAKAWAERYRRVSKAWASVKGQLKNGLPGEFQSLGRYKVPGKITAANDRGLTYSSPKLPAGGQLVPWKDLTAENVMVLSQMAQLSPLDQGLLAYALGSPKALELLNPANYTDPVEQDLAKGAHERAGKGAQEELAQTALAKAKASKEGNDPKAALEALAALSSGGPLAETAVARDHVAEITVMKEWADTAGSVAVAGPVAAQQPLRTTPETVAELKKLGWDTVEGLWVPDPKHKDTFKVTDGKLILNAKDAVGQVKFKLEAGSQVCMYGRSERNPVSPINQDRLRRQGSKIAPGYGIAVGGSSVKSYEASDLRWGGGRRGRRVGPPGMRIQIPVVKASDLKVRAGVHTLTMEVKGESVTLSLDGQQRTLRNIHPNGSFVLEVKGSAQIQKPQAKKMGL